MSHRSITMLAAGAALACSRRLPSRWPRAPRRRRRAPGSRPAGSSSRSARSTSPAPRGAALRAHQAVPHRRREPHGHDDGPAAQAPLRGLHEPAARPALRRGDEARHGPRGLGHAAVPDRRPGGGRVRPAGRPGLLDARRQPRVPRPRVDALQARGREVRPVPRRREVGEAIVDRRTGAVLEREVGQADGSFKEVDVLSQFQTLALTPRTRPLLRSARTTGQRGSQRRRRLLGGLRHRRLGLRSGSQAGRARG